MNRHFGYQREIQKKLIDFFKRNRIIVVSDILKGRGGLSANWILVTRYNKNGDTTTCELFQLRG